MEVSSSPSEHSILPLSGGVSGGHVTEEENSYNISRRTVVCVVWPRKLVRHTVSIIYRKEGITIFTFLSCVHGPAPKPQNHLLFDKSTKFLMGFVACVLSDFRRGGRPRLMSRHEITGLCWLLSC